MFETITGPQFLDNLEERTECPWGTKKLLLAEPEGDVHRGDAAASRMT